jgi:DNA-binding transcriptional regulator LsrR (DeoR family)
VYNNCVGFVDEVTMKDTLKELYENICWLLDTTQMTASEIADELNCPLPWVQDVIEERCI